MLSIFTLFYGFLVIVACLGALFVVFHLARYSLSRTQATFMLALFLIVFASLLIANIVLYANLPWDAIFPSLESPRQNQNGY